MTREAPGTLSVLDGTERIDVPAERLDAVASDWTPGGALFDGQVGLRTLRVGVRRDGGAVLGGKRHHERWYQRKTEDS